jgi:transcriptional regulator with XRE-family HTH domain
MTVRSGVGRPSSVFRATERYLHDSKVIGENVRRVRHSKGLTLEQAASRMEGDFRHFQRIEAGKVNLTLATMLRVAEALNVPLTQLFVDVGAASEPAIHEDGEPAEISFPTETRTESARLIGRERHEQHSSEVLRRVGRQVAALRQQRGLSSTALARLAGVTVSALRQIELGQDADLTVRQLIHLSQALDVPEESLLTQCPEETSDPR